MSLYALHASMSQRWTTERVARALLALDDVALPRKAHALLRKATASKHRWTSMSETFEQAVIPRRQLTVGRELFPTVKPPRRADEGQALGFYLERLKAHLKITGTRFDVDRPARDARPYGKRAFNKRFRYVKRLERKIESFQQAQRMRTLERMAKTLLAGWVTQADFVSDGRTACFLAWMTARLGRRSVFTCGSQERAYDQVADALLKGLGPEANWYAVAHVYPDSEVLARLTPYDRGRLLGQWFGVMVDAAEVLHRLAATGRYDLKRFVVRRGNDSSTWNAAAGAFNKAREGWLNTMHALGLHAAFDEMLPGKALRLMAADVVAWHGQGQLDPDTRVAAHLSPPWEVVLGRANCIQAQVQRACRAEGVVGRAWLKPRTRKVAKGSFTPELVHGVMVSAPSLAQALRRAGVAAGPSKSRGKTPRPVPAFRRVLTDDRVLLVGVDEAT